MPQIEVLVCDQPGRLRVESRPAPQRVDDLALVRPRRIGICGTDYHIFEGKHPFLQYPRVMGHELAVEVVEGPEGSGLAAGEVFVVNPYLSCGRCVACRAGRSNCCVRLEVLGVHCDGGMAGLISVPAANLVPAPDLSLDACATVEFLAIGAHAVRRSGAAAADRALVVGAGPIGLGVALFARLAGARVLLFDRDEARAAVVGTLAGVEVAAPGAALEAPPGNGDGAGFDLVFDATGNARAMEAGFDHVAHGGRYVLVGVVNETIRFSDPDFHRREATLLASRNATSGDFARVISAIRAGEVPVERIVTHRTSLSGAVDDLPRWATDKAGLVKAMIEID